MKQALFLILFTGFYILSYSQTTVSDTLEIIKDEQIQTDTILLNIDDTIKSPIGFKENVNYIDTLLQNESDSSITILLDSIVIDSAVIDSIVMDSVVIDSILNYPEFIDQLSDSIVFHKPDTTDFIIYNIQNVLDCDSIEINDSTRQAIDILFKSFKSRNLEASINYLNRVISDSSFISFSDTTILTLADSNLKKINDLLVKSISYLIDDIPEDSLNLIFTNMLKDSVYLNVKESESDSIRLKLFDKRGEFAVLWLSKSDDNKINVYLEDGISIEKPKVRKKVKKKIDTKVKIPGLEKLRKIDIIVPLWEFDNLADIRFNQGYLDSWAEGGENSMSAMASIKSNLNYSYGKLRTWETMLEYKLGYLKAGDNPIQKNDDRLEINTKFGKTAFKNWYYSALLNFKTQILKGYDYPNDSIPVSEFLSPANLVFSLGLDYKPNKKLTVLISPLTSKFTIVADTTRYDQARFGVGEDEIVRKEIGAYIKAISKIQFTEKIILENKINFFTNYVMKPQNIDVDWEADLAVKLNNNIKLSVNAHIIYDDDVNYVDKEGEVHGPRLQFKEMLGVGFIYSF